MRKMIVAMAVAVVACGGTETGESPNGAPAGDGAQSAAEAAQPAPQGQVHEVRMLLLPDGSYVYEPASLTIRQGDRVRWINVSGGPHNVAFYADRVPAGAAPILNAAMTNRMGNLAGGLVIAPNAIYEISFAGAPAGTYAYFCTPHEMVGMVAELTVRP